jgi:hypothetical protein
MYRCIFLLLIALCSYALHSQEPKTQKDSSVVKKDSINKIDYLNHLGNGYFPTRFLNVDLRYLIKFNQYEGLRTGLGGVTNDEFSEK